MRTVKNFVVSPRSKWKSEISLVYAKVLSISLLRVMSSTREVLKEELT